MAITDLCTLQQVKAWITDAPSSANDALLAALITSSTGAILSYCNRTPPNVQSFVDTFDGYGETSKLLRRWPVLSISSVTVDNTSVTLSSASGGSSYGGYSSGYVLQAWDG
ncbi:MAG: phage gp6-like head-tail connector protein, partial [Nitrospirae bacterium]